MRLSIIVPVFNERATILAVLDRVLAVDLEAEITAIGRGVGSDSLEGEAQRGGDRGRPGARAGRAGPRQRWETFARALRDHGDNGEVSVATRSDYGARYSVDGIIETPDGRNPRIRTVWIVDHEGDAPRLVTAHPLRKSDARRT